MMGQVRIKVRQRLKSTAPVVRIARSWSGEAEELRQNCLVSANWTTFKDSATDLNEYGMVVTDFIRKSVLECVLTKIIWVFPN